jgi:hypothetical protein
MGHRILYKYFSNNKYADDFLDGQLLFRSLSYFRNLEDGNVRGDEGEGISKYRPQTGLVINNLTQKASFVLKDFSFTSAVQQDEIFVFCVSMTHADQLYDEFHAVACVEITDIHAFCRRVQKALPQAASFPAAQPNRPRIGHKVEYYDETEGASPRWALPGRIAVSKLSRYAWQEEFRLAFSVTGAFRFENVSTQLIHDDHRGSDSLNEYPRHLVSAGSLRDIVKILRTE